MMRQKPQTAFFVRADVRSSFSEVNTRCSAYNDQAYYIWGFAILASGKRLKSAGMRSAVVKKNFYVLRQEQARKKEKAPHLRGFCLG